MTTQTVPTCPDCGRPITLQPSGWWSHDGMPDGCWRVSMDGPGEDIGAGEIPPPHFYRENFTSPIAGDRFA